MTEQERHRRIRDQLKDKPFATVRELVTALDASPATIRRDIDKLHGAGLVRKVFGGIAAIEPAGASERLSQRPFDENRVLAVEAKKAIAAEAEKLVRDGDSIIINGGSTCYLFGIRLARRNVRIYTNSMPLGAQLSETGTCSLVMAGGELHREPSMLYAVGGTQQPFFASKLFVGAQGIGPTGLLESHPLIAKLMAELQDWTDEVVVLADSRKFAIRARHVVYSLSRISTLVTDDGLTGTDATMLEDAGVRVIIAHPDSTGERGS